jgi:cellulose synthase/poly-beta-1,6-N-acetylglucosamine synthase-like glycosyltransferase
VSDQRPKPRLSFNVPAHNEERWIGKCLASIRTAMASVSEPYEVIVVDDASTDSTGLIARQMGARTLRVEHRNMEVVDDPANSGATVEQLLGALPEDYPHTFVVVADGVSMSQPDYPLLVVDLAEERGRHFRAIAAQVPSIDNNLSIGNMGSAEFAESVDESGVFRGIPGM